MRIISGKHKGKKVFQPIDKETRPLKDIARESIFNIIDHSNLFNIDIKNSHILDLFSGVGSFGLECLSRGALSATFFENYNKVLPVLKKNISHLDFANKTKIFEENVLETSSINNLDKKFDIIFLDPPYKERKVSQLLERLIKSNLLDKNGIFIIHRHKKEKDDFSNKFKILSEKSYGISKIIFGK